MMEKFDQEEPMIDYEKVARRLVNFLRNCVEVGREVTLTLP